MQLRAAYNARKVRLRVLDDPSRPVSANGRNNKPAFGYQEVWMLSQIGHSYLQQKCSPLEFGTDMCTLGFLGTDVVVIRGVWFIAKPNYAVSFNRMVCAYTDGTHMFVSLLDTSVNKVQLTFLEITFELVTVPMLLVYCLCKQAGLLYPTGKKIKNPLEKDNEFVSFIGAFAVEVFNHSYLMVDNCRKLVSFVKKIKEWKGSYLTYLSAYNEGREMFNKWQAQKWWQENYDEVMELYNVQRLNRQAFPLPTPPRSEDESSLKFKCIGDSPITPPLSRERLPRTLHRPMGMGYSSSDSLDHQCLTAARSNRDSSGLTTTPKLSSISGAKTEISSMDASISRTSSSREADRSGELSISNVSDIENE
ncbi:Brevis radix-like protein 4 [Tanacetum coccineum]